MKNEILDLIKKQNELEVLVSKASKDLNKFPKGAMGLTPDEVKSSVEFKNAKSKFNIAFNDQRNFNSNISNSVKRQMSKIRRNLIKN